ncbi:MAG: hypothetical protein LBB72_06480 [Spirochaetaceae bacterium]|jgi:hypothetical protein|nr:hypothetical protein [Spirochaetaceae bacterium]
MKKIVTVLKIAGACAVIVMMAACSAAFQPAASGEIPVPAGKGVINLSVVTSAARTIFPDGIEGFDYIATFTTDSADVVEDEVTASLSGGKAAVVLEPATWKIVITAVLDGEDVGEAVIENVALGEGEVKKFNDIYIQPIRGDAEDGALVYSVTIPEDATDAKLYYICEDDGSATGEEIDLLGADANEGTVKLSPGAYLVRVLITVDGITAGKTEIVYIYTGLKSTLNWSFVISNEPYRLVIEDFETGGGNFWSEDSSAAGYWHGGSGEWDAGFSTGDGEAHNGVQGVWFNNATDMSFGRTDIYYDLSNYTKITFWVKAKSADVVFAFRLNDDDDYKVEFSVDTADTWEQKSFTMEELGFTGDVIIEDWAFIVVNDGDADGPNFIDYICAERPLIIDDFSLTGHLNDADSYWAESWWGDFAERLDRLCASLMGTDTGSAGIGRIDQEWDLTEFSTITFSVFTDSEDNPATGDKYKFGLDVGPDGDNPKFFGPSFTVEDEDVWADISLNLAEFKDGDGNLMTPADLANVTGWRLVRDTWDAGNAACVYISNLQANP